ncbi:MAG: hypothetical protein ABID54_03045 [Pseudomonadota bacterium]
MPDLQKYLDTMNSEAFSKASYQEQLDFRSRHLPELLGNDERFMALPTEEKDVLFRKMLFSPPKMQNKERETQVREIAEKALAGDKGAANFMVATVAGHAAVDNSFFTATLDKLSETKVGEFLFETLPSAIRGGGEKFNAWEMAMGDDMKKSVAYFDYLLNSKKQLASAAHAFTLPIVGPVRWQDVGAMGGLVAELAPLYATMVGTIVKPFVAGTKVPSVVGQLMNGVDNLFAMGSASFPAKQSAYRLTRALTHAFVGGSAVGFVRENTKDILNNIAQKPLGQLMIENAKEHFGEYVVGDLIAFGFGGALLKGGRFLRKVFTGFDKSASIYKGITVRQLNDIITNATTGNTFDMALYYQLPKRVQESVDNLMIRGNTLRHVVEATPLEKLQVAAGARGIDIVEQGKRLKLHEITTDWTKTVSSIDDAYRAMISRVGADSFQPSKKVAALVGAAATKTKVRQKIKGSIPLSELNDVDVLTRMIAPVGGRFQGKDARNFTKALLASLGEGDEVLRDVSTLTTSKGLQVKLGKDVLATLPMDALNPEAEFKAVSSLVDAIVHRTSRDVRAEGLAAAADKALVKKRLEALVDWESYRASLHRQQLYTPGWSDYAADKVLGGKILKESDNTLTVMKGSTPLGNFDNYDDLGEWMVAQTIDPDHFRKYLWDEYGFTLERNASTGRWKVKAQGSVVYEAEHISDVIIDGGFNPKIASELGPELAVVDNGTLEVTYRQGIAVGKYKDILKNLDNFTDKQVVPKFVGKNLKLHEPSRTVEVFVPDINYRKSFKSIDAAKKYLQGGWDEYEELTKIAGRKGYRVMTDGGMLHLYDETGGSITVHSLEELKAVSTKIPVPEYAPEFTQLQDEILHGIKTADGELFTGHFVTEPTKWDFMPEKNSPLLNIQAYYRPPDAWLIKAVEKGADPEFLKIFRGTESTRRLMRQSEEHWRKVIISTFKPGGKTLSKSERLPIKHLLELDEELWGLAKEAWHLSDDQLKVATNLKREFKAMGELFGVDPDRMLQEYFPHIRKELSAYWNKGELDSEIRNLFGSAREAKPRTLDAFFEHSRVVDVANLVYEDDPLKAILKYSSVGHRKTFLGDFWKDATDFLSSPSGEKMDSKAQIRVLRYLADVMGVPSARNDVFLREFVQDFADKIGWPKNYQRDLIAALREWGYVGAMGMRPWLPIRNMFQIFTTLAPRVGNSHVWRAAHKVAEDKAGDIFHTLRNKGVLQPDLPVYGGELISESTLRGKLAKAGLKWYRNSDDWTRAVAYTATFDKFMVAAGDFASHKIDYETFAKRSGYRKVAKDLRVQIEGLIQDGKWNSAADSLAYNMVQETMFPYRSGTGFLFTGAVGKLFGQFGHYSMWYTENVKRMIKYSMESGGIGEVALTAGTWLANTTALYAGMKNIFGIDEKAFLFWNPMTFSGGPFFNLGIDFLSAIMDLRSYKGDVAKAKVFGLTRKDGKLHWDFESFKKSEIAKWYPYGFQHRSMKKAVEYLNTGDYYRAFLAMTSAPIRKDWLD